MNNVIRLRRPRAPGSLVFRWSVVLAIVLLIVLPVYVQGGSWLPLSVVAVVFLLACIPVIGLEYYAADTIEFEDQKVRLRCGAQVAQYPVDDIRISKPLWLRIVKGRGLLLKANDGRGFVLLLGDKKVLKKTLMEFENRGVRLFDRST